MLLIFMPIEPGQFRCHNQASNRKYDVLNNTPRSLSVSLELLPPQLEEAHMLLLHLSVEYNK